MISQTAKEKATKLLRAFFGENYFNEYRMSYIFDAVRNLNDSQFLNLVEECLKKEHKPGLNWFLMRSKDLRDHDHARDMLKTNEDRPGCTNCGDCGIVFVQTERRDMKSLAMNCTCSCSNAIANFWDLPVYNADHVIIKNPYSEFRKKVGFWKSADYFAQHMKKSKLIWDGEL